MGLSHEHAGLEILAKIKIYILSRAKLLCTVWDEIPCISRNSKSNRYWKFQLSILTNKSVIPKKVWAKPCGLNSSFKSQQMAHFWIEDFEMYLLPLANEILNEIFFPVSFSFFAELVHPNRRRHPKN